MLSFSYRSRAAEERPWQLPIAALPCMTGFASCQLVNLLHAQLPLLLSLLPDVRELRLVGCDEVNDIELQEVAVCTRLTSLDLTACEQISPMGALSICQRCPTLHYLYLMDCVRLVNLDIGMCERLLRKDGLCVKIINHASGSE